MRQQIIHQDYRRPDTESGGELAQAIVETQRQHREDAVLLSVLQILGDAAGADDEIAVRQHHAFGFAGATGSVEDGGQVAVGAAMCLGSGGGGDARHQCIPSYNFQSGIIG